MKKGPWKAYRYGRNYRIKNLVTGHDFQNVVLLRGCRYTRSTSWKKLTTAKRKAETLNSRVDELIGGTKETIDVQS